MLRRRPRRLDKGTFADDEGYAHFQQCTLANDAVEAISSVAANGQPNTPRFDSDLESGVVVNPRALKVRQRDDGRPDWM